MTHTTSRLTLRQREAIACACFIAPAVLGFMVFTAAPLLASAWLSLTDYALAGWPNFVGLDNYRALLEDEFWLRSVRVTVQYAVVAVPMWLISSLALALIMNQKLRGVAIFRTIYYLPAVLSGVATAMLWGWILNARVGILNLTLRFVGLQGPNWLGDEDWALWSLILISLYTMGWYLPIWLGGLQSIPTDLYEAATIDGAGWWGRLHRITLPMLSPTIFFNLVTGIIAAFKIFTAAYVATGGGPYYASYFYVLHLFNNFFKYLNMGYASALAWILFVIIMIFTAIQLRFARRWVYYESETAGF